ncbi:MAG: RNA 2',3'-cyclic phosphodiesterase [Candidatus Woesearchaeota archaeon]|jgi:2'-5' RNA ligase
MRCFIAVEIPEEIQKKFNPLYEELKLKHLKAINPKDLHITLKFLDEVSEKTAVRVQQELQTISFKPFSVSLKGIECFPNRRNPKVLWVGCDSPGLKSLSQQINELLKKEFKKEDFTAHLTIARIKEKVDLKGFIEKYNSLDFGTFICKSFEVKQSVLLLTGPEYSNLKKFHAV